MAIILSTAEDDFEARFSAFLGAKRAQDVDVRAQVAAMIAAVREEGDAALMRYTAQFDRLELTPETVALSKAEIAAAVVQVDRADRAALELAAERIRAYHARQKPQPEVWFQDESGAELGWRWGAVDRAGLYVPGGMASYPSSVLMNAIPARVAGVRELVITAPMPGGVINPLVVCAAELAGVDQIYRIGGAQAIAALAYGTQSIAPVDKITGPGNAYVAEAKRQVFGHVGIDMIAGPSEVLIIADAQNNPDWVALDLMSQAEHDADAQAILITDDAAFGAAVVQAVSARLKTLERREIARKSWEAFGAVLITRSLEEAAELSNRIAPEHLEILTVDPKALAQEIRHAGAIFLGQWTPEAIGDYVGGPNHVLPTSRSARFSSGLSVLDFMKRSTLSAFTPAALRATGPSAARLARAEGLEAHGLSVTARLAHLNEGADDAGS